MRQHAPFSHAQLQMLTKTWFIVRVISRIPRFVKRPVYGGNSGTGFWPLSGDTSQTGRQGIPGGWSSKAERALIRMSADLFLIQITDHYLELRNVLTRSERWNRPRPNNKETAKRVKHMRAIADPTDHQLTRFPIYQIEIKWRWRW